MEAFEVNQKVENGKIVIVLPERFNDKEVKVKITVADEFGDEKDWANLPSHKKVELLKKFTGSAKYPNVETNKYDVYDQ
ncbi:MAG: hypothetical protein LH478_09620 [Chitinophagaceae bacterium]|nr:hypothetical protein [Chitinophagaceae bacterium]